MAFKNCGVEKVIIGGNSKLKTIGDYAFSNCESLMSITIPESVISIEMYAFSDCNSLHNILWRYAKPME